MRKTLMTASLALAMMAGGVTAQDGLRDSIKDAVSDLSASEILEREAKFIPEAPELAMPTLMPGDEAPALSVATFVKGAPISEFERGTAYLIDFWATWCGPCIASIPHLASLQDTYGDDNFRVVGVSIWERETGDELIEHVTAFVDGRTDDMRYTVAIDNNGAMAESWMAASGQQGIPTAMLVDREGKIAWIGYGNDPAMDDAIASVVAGDWNLADAREARLDAIDGDREQAAFMPWYGHFRELAASGEFARAGALAAALFTEGRATDPRALNAMAWTMVEEEGWDTASLQAAKQMVTKALEEVNWSSPDMMDTLAWAEHRLGNHDEAVRVQTRAIETAETAEEREMLTSSLEVFKKAAGQG